MGFEFDTEGLEELRQAVARNPQKVLDEVSKFLTRGGAVYKSTILNNPWRLGMAGGGAPRASGNLAGTHVTDQSTWEWRIKPTAGYAIFVHEGTRKMSSRPWLDYAQEQNRGEIEKLETELLDNLINDLSE